MAQEPLLDRNIMTFDFWNSGRACIFHVICAGATVTAVYVIMQQLQVTTEAL